MPKKYHKPEEIVSKLREVDVLTSQGSTVADAIRQIGVTEITYYRWRASRLARHHLPQPSLHDRP
jgi:transposase-like protein